MALSFVSSLYIFNTVFSFTSLGAQAAPISQLEQKRQSGFTTLSTAQIDTFAPFTHYASTAYCPSSQTLTWSCGANCDANPGFQPVASGGDGDDVQFWYVGIDPDLETVIVGHQGTDPKKLMPLLTDADFFLSKLDTTLFPGVASNIKVHNGFADAHAETASDVLSAVQTALDQSGVNKVTVVGHSLGAAKALLDGVFLPLHLPGVPVKVIGYGMPRVGNQAFANYVDANLDVTHVNNKQDLVPILPGRFLGFAHASGETHIQNDESWVTCPGQDNTDSRCTVGDVKNILEGSISNHDGPYDGIKIGC